MNSTLNFFIGDRLWSWQYKVVSAEISIFFSITANLKHVKINCSKNNSENILFELVARDLYAKIIRLLLCKQYGLINVNPENRNSSK